MLHSSLSRKDVTVMIQKSYKNDNSLLTIEHFYHYILYAELCIDVSQTIACDDHVI